MNEEARKAAYKSIVRAIIRDVKAAFADRVVFSLEGEGEELVSGTTKERDILDSLWSCDDETLRIVWLTTGKVYSVSFVFSNGPEDFVSDYSEALGPHLKRALAMAAKYEAGANRKEEPQGPVYEAFTIAEDGERVPLKRGDKVTIKDSIALDFAYVATDGSNRIATQEPGKSVSLWPLSAFPGLGVRRLDPPRADPKPHKITIQWGSAAFGDPPTEEYEFATAAELAAFREGVAASSGWMDYAILGEDEEEESAE